MAKINDTIKFTGRASNPSTPAEGELYYNSSDKKLKVYDGTTFKNVGIDSFTEIEETGFETIATTFDSGAFDRTTFIEFLSTMYLTCHVSASSGNTESENVTLHLTDGTNEYQLSRIVSTGNSAGGNTPTVSVFTSVNCRIFITNNGDGTVDINLDGMYNQVSGGTSGAETAANDSSSTVEILDTIDNTVNDSYDNHQFVDETLTNLDLSTWGNNIYFTVTSSNSQNVKVNDWLLLD